MASFWYSGSFRQTQWKLLRDWLLRERMSVPARLDVIDAELRRLGLVILFFKKTKTTSQSGPGEAFDVVEKVTSIPVGLSVSAGSSLEKLVQSYVVLGGNPCEISLFLRPDEVKFSSRGTDPDEDPSDDPNVRASDARVPGAESSQPGFGVVAPENIQSYGPGGVNTGGYPTFDKFPYRRIGRVIERSEASAKIAAKIEYAKRWAEKEIAERRLHLEAKVLKLMDLREQLQQERDEILVQCVGGTVPPLPDPPDPRRFHRGLHLSRIVEEMDGVFYEKATDGSGPDFGSVNLGTAEKPTGLSLYDTLWYDGQGGIEDDPYTG